MKWTCDRAARRISADEHARDNIVEAELALDKDGKFLGVRIRSYGNLGAYRVVSRRNLPPVRQCRHGGRHLSRPRRCTSTVSGVLTNTNRTAPYRGAGRPEAIYMIERLIDDRRARAAASIPSSCGAATLIPPTAMPYKTPLGVHLRLRRLRREHGPHALKLADWRGFEARREKRPGAGMLRGIGIANAIEQAAGPATRCAEIRFDPSGGMTLSSWAPRTRARATRRSSSRCWTTGSASTPSASSSSTATPTAVAFGMGTIGSRSTVMGGGACRWSADKVIAKGKKLAAHMLEAAEDDIEFADGSFTLAGTDRAMGSRRSRRRRSSRTSCRPAWSPASTRPPPSRPSRQPSQRLPRLRGRDRSRDRRRRRSSATAWSTMSAP